MEILTPQTDGCLKHRHGGQLCCRAHTYTHTNTHTHKDKIQSDTDTEELCQYSTNRGSKSYKDMLEAVSFVLKVSHDAR